MPIVFFSGKLIDLVGRRPGAVVILTSTSAGVLGSYTFTSFWPLTVALTFAVVGVSAVLTVLNAFTTELFPTELRSSAFAWSNNIIGRVGYWLSPFVVGEVAKTTGWGLPLRVSAIFPLFAILLILWLLPETRGKELEDSAALPPQS
jgi:putative MFS transporter